MSDRALGELKELGNCFGLAFQIYDDIMDVVSTPEEMGKATHKDQSEHKNTYPGLLGLDGAYEELEKAKRMPKRIWKCWQKNLAQKRCCLKSY